MSLAGVDYGGLVGLLTGSENPPTKSEDFRAPNGDLYSNSSKLEQKSQAKGAKR